MADTTIQITAKSDDHLISEPIAVKDDKLIFEPQLIKRNNHHYELLPEPQCQPGSRMIKMVAPEEATRGAKSFIFQIRDTNGVKVCDNKPNKTAICTVTDLRPNKSYLIRYAAVDAHGVERWSREKSIKTHEEHFLHSILQQKNLGDLVDELRKEILSFDFEGEGEKMSFTNCPSVNILYLGGRSSAKSCTITNTDAYLCGKFNAYYAKFSNAIGGCTKKVQRLNNSHNEKFVMVDPYGATNENYFVDNFFEKLLLGNIQDESSEEGTIETKDGEPQRVHCLFVCIEAKRNKLAQNDEKSKEREKDKLDDEKLKALIRTAQQLGVPIIGLMTKVDELLEKREGKLDSKELFSHPKILEARSEIISTFGIQDVFPIFNNTQISGASVPDYAREYVNLYAFRLALKYSMRYLRHFKKTVELRYYGSKDTLACLRVKSLQDPVSVIRKASEYKSFVDRYGDDVANDNEKTIFQVAHPHETDGSVVVVYVKSDKIISDQKHTSAPTVHDVVFLTENNTTDKLGGLQKVDESVSLVEVRRMITAKQAVKENYQFYLSDMKTVVKAHQEGTTKFKDCLISKDGSAILMLKTDYYRYAIVDQNNKNCGTVRACSNDTLDIIQEKLQKMKINVEAFQEYCGTEKFDWNKEASESSVGEIQCEKNNAYVICIRTA